MSGLISGPAVTTVNLCGLSARSPGAVCVARGKNTKKIYTNMTVNFLNLPTKTKMGIL